MGQAFLPARVGAAGLVRPRLSAPATASSIARPGGAERFAPPPSQGRPPSARFDYAEVVVVVVLRAASATNGESVAAEYLGVSAAGHHGLPS